MKKQILNLGKALNKVEQKSINGGAPTFCESHEDCPGGFGCCFEQMFCRTDDYFTQGLCPGNPC